MDSKKVDKFSFMIWCSLHYFGSVLLAIDANAFKVGELFGEEEGFWKTSIQRTDVLYCFGAIWCPSLTLLAWINLRQGMIDNFDTRENRLWLRFQTLFRKPVEKISLFDFICSCQSKVDLCKKSCTNKSCDWLDIREHIIWK